MATALSELEDPAPSDEELELIDRYWRAANYLSVGQIYLLENPLLRQPLALEHVKPRLLGHWGTTPGLNFIYVTPQPCHQRARPEHRLHLWTWSRRAGAGRQHVPRGHLLSELYPDISEDVEGMRAARQAVLLPRRHPEPRAPQRFPARSTRAASSGTRSRTRSAQRSTIPT